MCVCVLVCVTAAVHGIDGSRKRRKVHHAETVQLNTLSLCSLDLAKRGRPHSSAPPWLVDPGAGLLPVPATLTTEL